MRSSRSSCMAFLMCAISPSTTAWNLSSFTARCPTTSRRSACTMPSVCSRVTRSRSSFSWRRKMSSPTRFRLCASRSSRATRSSSSPACVSSTLCRRVERTCSMSTRRCSFSSRRVLCRSAKVRERASMDAVKLICISRICMECFSCMLDSSASMAFCSDLSASIRRLISASRLRSSLFTESTRPWRFIPSASRREFFSDSRSL
mmetsp:Transcript_18366/g.40144  ORF Transcript_18366/g.40144 Transcript_18366/m.40144 type:complete len:204 (+) Transcript_18366:205-816(+)